ncbi:MAG: hypothetical protein RLY86_1293 [Pseudomonadota bacterium]|jgi:DUF1365 family protein
MPDPARHALYRCVVGHWRHRPFRHGFRYRVWALLLDLDRLDDLPAPLVHNRAGLLSIQDRDHGARDGTPLRPWVEARLRDAGLIPPGGPIRMLCFPRVLGYTFNPLTLYWCHDREGRPAAMVYEVKNTFGDQHVYVCPYEAGPGTAAGPAGRVEHGHAKEFHVSPFFGMGGAYRFRLGPLGDRLSVTIDYADGDGPLLTATQTGLRQDLTSAALWRTLAAHPLVTLKVIAGIHWEAWKLWRKGAVFHRRPNPPVRSIPRRGAFQGAVLYPPTGLAAAETRNISGAE